MTLSATTTFNLSAQDFIDLSLTDVGAIGPSVNSSDPNLRDHALKLLNILVKSIDREGILTWRAPRRVTTCTSGQASYALATDAYDVDQPARYVQSGSSYGSQVTAISRDDYMTLPDRTIQGIPMQYYIERALDPTTALVQITAYLYPVPPNTGDTVEFATQARAADLTSLSQTLDVNQKWLDAIRWGLTHSISPAYNVPIDRMSYYRKVAEDALRDTLQDDNEKGPVQLVPFANSYYGYGGY